MEWSNDKVLKLIGLYRDRPVLWDCRLKDYKDKNKKNENLLEIAVILGVDIGEIIRKIKNLVCHFSREIKKEKEGNKSGAGSDDVYKSKWFCYNSMLFLRYRNKPTGTDTLKQDQETSKNVETIEEETQNADHLDHSVGTSGSGIKRRKRVSKSLPKKRKSATDGHSVMRDIGGCRALKDQYSAFGEEIGMRIRDLPFLNAKTMVKHAISTILFEAEMGKYDNQQSFITNYSHPFYHLPTFSHPSLSSLPVPGPMPGSSACPRHTSYSGIMSPTIEPQQSATSHNSSSYGDSDSDSIDSILKEI